jgi:hypothetical protein
MNKKIVKTPKSGSGRRNNVAVDEDALPLPVLGVLIFMAEGTPTGALYTP